MKKLVCAILALAMLLSGVCAMAESEASPMTSVNP